VFDGAYSLHFALVSSKEAKHVKMEIICRSRNAIVPMENKKYGYVLNY
jgi:hypothetical protein